MDFYRWEYGKYLKHCSETGQLPVDMATFKQEYSAGKEILPVSDWLKARVELDPDYFAASYLKDGFEYDEAARLPSSELYGLYVEHCEQNDKTPFSQVMFGRIVGKLFGKATGTRKDGKIVKTYRVRPIAQ